MLDAAGASVLYSFEPQCSLRVSGGKASGPWSGGWQIGDVANSFVSPHRHQVVTTEMCASVFPPGSESPPFVSPARAMLALEEQEARQRLAAAHEQALLAAYTRDGRFPGRKEARGSKCIQRGSTCHPWRCGTGACWGWGA